MTHIKFKTIIIWSEHSKTTRFHDDSDNDDKAWLRQSMAQM